LGSHNAHVFFPGKYKQNKSKKKKPVICDGVLLTVVKPLQDPDVGTISNVDVLKSRMQKGDMCNLVAPSVENLSKVYSEKNFKEIELDRCRMRVQVFCNDQYLGQDISEVKLL
jgi:hypothetical protein